GAPALFFWKRFTASSKFQQVSRMRRPQSAAAEPIVANEPDRVTVMHHRIVAGDFFVDRHQNFLFPYQLKKMTELDALPLDDLPDGHGRTDLACQIALAVRGLELTHERNRHHINLMLSCR